MIGQNYVSPIQKLYRPCDFKTQIMRAYDTLQTTRAIKEYPETIKKRFLIGIFSGLKTSSGVTVIPETRVDWAIGGGKESFGSGPRRRVWEKRTKATRKLLSSSETNPSA